MTTATATQKPQQASLKAPPNSPSPAEPPSLYALVRERLELSDEADPASVVADLLEDLDDAAIRVAARRGLQQVTHEVIKDLRRRQDVPSDGPQPSGKWDSVARAAQDHPEIFAVRVVIDMDAQGKPVWRFLGDCNARQLERAEEILRRRALGLKNYADSLAAVRARLKTSKQLVRELPADRVHEVFNA